MPRDYAPAACLDVERSLTGRRWIGPSPETERRAEALAQRTGLPDALCRLLAGRGVAPEACEGFLAPRLKDLLPDPLGLRDMGAAADRLIAALVAREPIAIFADYDVDGGASAALLLRWLRAQGHDATLYIPDRIAEGYGPNAPAMADLARVHTLIVCVDCGTLSHGAIAAAEGADVVVLDHHLGAETLPPAIAVVNPNRADESGGLSHLCAAAVVFLLLVEANRRLPEGRRRPDLMGLLDLVALATVADVAPLVGVNRALVRQGLRVMAGRARPGLTALADIAGLATAPAAHHLGFVLGPRINAGGRIGAADLGARLLATDDAAEAAALAARLDALNDERRAIEGRVRDEALAQAEARGTDGPLVWAAGEGWHQGVVGIVAARLAETFGRPAVAIALDGSAAKGSGRSVAGVDLGAAVQRLAAEGLLAKGGGHPMAAGLSLAREGLEAAMARLSTLLARQSADAAPCRDLQITGLLMPGAAGIELVRRIEAAGPFGMGAPAPRFALPAQTVRAPRAVGERHLAFTVGDPGARLDVVAFGAMEGPLATLRDGAGGPMHLAGRLEIDDWGGRLRPRLRLDDAAPATP